MSKLVVLKTKIKITDLDMLKQAVIRTGVPVGCLTTGANMELQGYGKTKVTADLIVSRDWTTGYSALGFQRTPDGYVAHVDHLDDANIMRKQNLPGRSYIGYVAQWYTALQAQKALQRDGFLTKVKVEGPEVVVLASR